MAEQHARDESRAPRGQVEDALTRTLADLLPPDTVTQARRRVWAQLASEILAADKHGPPVRKKRMPKGKPEEKRGRGVA